MNLESRMREKSFHHTDTLSESFPTYTVLLLDDALLIARGVQIEMLNKLLNTYGDELQEAIEKMIKALATEVQ